MRLGITLKLSPNSLTIYQVPAQRNVSCRRSYPETKCVQGTDRCQHPDIIHTVFSTYNYWSCLPFLCYPNNKSKRYFNLRMLYKTFTCILSGLVPILTRNASNALMGGRLAVYVLFNSISVISGRIKVNNERLCAMELRLRRFRL